MRKLTVLGMGGYAAAFTFAFASAQAAETTVTTWADRIRLGFSSTFHGNSLGDLGNPYALNADGVSGGDRIFIDNRLAAAYPINDKWSIGPEVRFVVSPVVGGSFAWGAPGVRAVYRPPNLRSRLHVRLPFAWDPPLNIRFSPSVRYVVPNTRWMVGAFTEFKAYLIPTNRTFKAYMAPFAAYFFKRGLAASLLTEWELRHDVGAPNLWELRTHMFNVQPGAVIMFSDDAFLNPFVKIFPVQGLSVDRMAIGANFSAAFL